jgi:phage terminase large subunit-like protein
LNPKLETAVNNALYAQIADLPALQKIAVTWRIYWLSTAHQFQILPKGDHWTVWLLLAGRGSGKTKCAANNIGWWAWEQPKTRGLVMAPTANDIRFTCFEGDSGLLNTIPPELIQNYNKSTFELELKNGSHLRGISADSYERLRGPQFHYAWTDELAAFEYLQEAWDMMMFGLRLGKLPRDRKSVV